MFQKSRPSVSNRFQADSSSTSMETCFMASVTLRLPASKAAWMAATEAEHQQAQRGSSRREASGTMIVASLERARSVRKRRNSVVRKGMSQLRIKAKEHGSRPNSGVLSRESVSLRRWRAVRIPPRGPRPALRSAITGHGSSAYFPTAATMVTSWQTLASNSPVRWSIVFPPAAQAPCRCQSACCRRRPVRNRGRSFFLLGNFLARAANTQFAKPLLQTLPVQSNRRRRPRNIPPMHAKLPQQVRNFKLALGFAKILLLQPQVFSVGSALGHNGRAMQPLFRQIVRTNLFATREHQATLNRILQLAHVPRPIVVLQRLQRFLAEPRRSPQPRPMQPHKRFRKDGNVFFVCPQRRQLNRHHPQPIKKILAKFSVANRQRQIPMRRADHPYIHRNRLRPAQSLHGAIFQRTQDFRLCHWIHIPNFVQKQRPAVRLLKAPFFLLRRPGERSALVSKKFRFNQCLR